MFGLEPETVKTLAVFFGTAIAAVLMALKGAQLPKKTRATESQVTDYLEKMLGEIRHMRQELRIEAKDTHKQVEAENRLTREQIAQLRDILIELRAIIKK